MTTWRFGLRGHLLFLLLHSGIVVAECQVHRDQDHQWDLPRGVSRVSLTNEAGPWSGFKLLLGTHLGDVRVGLASVKRYLLQFGYIDASQAPPEGTTFTDTFDNVTQSAVLKYQRSFRLPLTGTLDIATITQMIIPRCGREDVVNGTLLLVQNGSNPNASQHVGVHRYRIYAPHVKWFKENLTYAINETGVTPNVSLTDIQISIDSAFATWAAHIPLSFTRIRSLSRADIKISFGARQHGDLDPFDGPLGVLAHAESPQGGDLHFDVDETWTVDVRKELSPTAFDLTSVAIHEIGHILGLSHSAFGNAVMYPSISRLTEVRSLSEDDIVGMQSLYGVKRSTTPLPAPGPEVLGSVSNLTNAAVASWRRPRVTDGVTSVTLALAAVLVAPASW